MSTSANRDNLSAIAAAREGVAVCDRSHWGTIAVSDADRIRFLHNQSTNDFNSLKPGQGCDTVFVTSTARTIDLATAYILPDSILLIVSPNQSDSLMAWLDRYIFFADRVKLKNITQETAILSLIGPDSDSILSQLGAEEMIGQPEGNHQVFTIQDIEVRVAVGNGLGLPGYNLIFNSDRTTTIWETLTNLGAISLNDSGWEQLRIEQGRPTPDKELTDEHNPLEVGLWQTISFTKGCYIGQETIARLNTYKGVRQQLWGVRLSAPAEPGMAVTVGEEKVGKLTSYIDTETGGFGLAYIRTKAGGVGLKVQVGDSIGEVVPVPFVSHEYP